MLPAQSLAAPTSPWCAACWQPIKGDTQPVHKQNVHLRGSSDTGAPVLKAIAACADGADHLLAMHCIVDNCMLNDCVLLVKSNVQAQPACPRLEGCRISTYAHISTYYSEDSNA